MRIQRTCLVAQPFALVRAQGRGAAGADRQADGEGERGREALQDRGRLRHPGVLPAPHQGRLLQVPLLMNACLLGVLG